MQSKERIFPQCNRQNKSFNQPNAHKSIVTVQRVKVEIIGQKKKRSVFLRPQKVPTVHFYTNWYRPSDLFREVETQVVHRGSSTIHQVAPASCQTSTTSAAHLARSCRANTEATFLASVLFSFLLPSASSILSWNKKLHKSTLNITTNYSNINRDYSKLL